MSISDHILKFGSSFDGRLDKGLLDFAMDYVNRGECALALDTLFEYLYENEVSITTAEYRDAIFLAKQLNISEDDLLYLKQIIESN